jgi:hypothetical protein
MIDYCTLLGLMISPQICPSGMMIDRLGNLNNRTKANKNLMTGWWFGTFLIFHHIWVVILPIDELIFFRGVAQPPTSDGTIIIKIMIMVLILTINNGYILIKNAI